MSVTTAVTHPDEAAAPTREKDRTISEMQEAASEAYPSFLSRVRSAIAKPWLINGVRLVFVAAVLLAVGYALVHGWTEIQGYLFGLAWQSVLLSFAAVFLGMGANIMAWRTIVRGLESDVSVPAAGRITLLGNLAKYLPGSVWAYVAQMELGKRAGIPRARAFVASIIAVGLSTTASLVVGLFGLPALSEAELGQPFVYIVLALIPIALVCSHPAVLTRLVELFLKLLRKQPLGHRLTWGTVLPALGWSTLAFVGFGFHLWLLANAEATPGVGGVFRSIGAFSLAMTCGILFFVVPSGIGIRDAVIAAALTPYVGGGIAIAIATASRLVFTIADVLAAGAAGGSVFLQRRREGAAPMTAKADD